MTRYIVVVNNLFGNLFLYDEKGKLVHECLLGQDVKTNPNNTIKFVEFLTTTGLQIKTDSGIPLVYFSFLLLMISVFISYISYSQIWEVGISNTSLVGGKSNRAVLFFQEELQRLLQNSKV